MTLDDLSLSWPSEARVRPSRSATVSMQVLTMAPSPLPPGENKPVGYIYFRIFRMIRVLRMMRAMKYWPGLLRIFMCLLGAARQVANIFVLLFIFMTMFALLGMQLFGGKIDTQKSRAHYDYYYPAILTVLSTFSGGWVDPYVAASEV